MLNRLILMVFATIFMLNALITGQVSEKGRPGGMDKIGKITGVVIDTTNGLPLEYANILIYRQKDTSLVTGGITNPDGAFSIDELPAGQYIVKVKFLGYQPHYVSNIRVMPNSPEVNVGKVYLSMVTVKTEDVVITAEKDAVVHSLDKKVINVDKNFSATGGSATDVLQNVPSINVDVEGNVSMRGSSNLTILIDGKPSGMSALSSADVLNQIPASQIESIEIITNPSAKYDPEGTAGIINVVMKKKGVTGFNGQITAFGGTGNKYNGSAIFNYRINGLAFNFGYDNRTNNFFSNSTNTRESYVSSSSALINQDVSGTGLMAFNNINFGADYTFNQKDNIGFSFKKRFHTFGNDTRTETKNYNSAGFLTSDYLRTSDGPRNMGGNEYSLNYKKVFDGIGKELTADITYTDFYMYRDEIIRETDYLSGSVIKPEQRTGTDNTNNTISVQTDYTHQLDQSSKFEAGYKSTFRTLTMRNNYEYFSLATNAFEENLLYRNYFDLKEQIHAVYSNYTGSVADLFKFQGGLRIEQVYSEGNLLTTGEKFNNDYFALYPSAYISKQFGTDEILLSYSRRVDRPGNRQINPYINLTDSTNLFYGNPKLKPQFINSYELGYMLTLGKTTVTTTGFWRATSGVISTVTTIGTDGVTRTTYANVSRQNDVGVDISSSIPILPFWRVNAGFSYYNIRFEEDKANNISAFNDNNWTAKLNSNIFLGPGTGLQLSVNYRSPYIVAQGKMSETFSVDLGGRKEFLDGDLTVSFRVSDIFNTLKQRMEVSGPGFTAVLDGKRESRMAFLGITYKIFNFKAKEQKRDRESGGDMDF